MGGNALKHVRTRRVTLHEFQQASARVVEVLASAPPGAGPTRATVVPSFRNKQTFGDLDVLVCWGEGGQGEREQWVASVFGAREVVTNGPVCSFDLHDLQVDFIGVDEDVFSFALAYLSWNDLGGLLGRVFRFMGGCLTHRGLEWAVDDNGKGGRVLVTACFDTALQLAGYSAERFQAGFDTREDIFHFVVSSPHFHPDAFHPDTGRTQRMRKRETQRGFLDFLRSHPLPHRPRARPRDHWLRVFCDAVPEFAQRLRERKDALREERALRERRRGQFSGGLVMEWTGCRGARLGAVMRALREERGGEDGLRAFVEGVADKEEVREWVVAVAERVQEEQ